MSEENKQSTPAPKPAAAKPAASKPGERPAGSRPPGRFAKKPGGPGGFKRRGPSRRRMPSVCLDKNGTVDWKAVNTLRNFITDKGKILSARQTGAGSACQRKIKRAIKRARFMALLPVASHY